MAAARSVHEGRALQYNGRLYAVPPVPFAAGLELQGLVVELNALQSEDWTEGVAVRLMEFCQSATRLFRRLVRPVGWYQRLVWRARRNPFRDASEGEIGQLLGFFFSCRTTSTVRHEVQAGPPSTSPTSSMGSATSTGGRP